jgi:hypothetical protein
MFVIAKFNDSINVGSGNGAYSKADSMECQIEINLTPEMNNASYNALSGNLLDERMTHIEIILNGIDFKTQKIHITYYNSYISTTGL